MTAFHSENEKEGLDILLKVLSNRTRRQLLRRWVRGEDTVSTISDLSEALRPEVETPSTVKTALYHNHLPLFADAGIVDVDWERETVRYQGGYRVETLLERVTAESETARS